MTITEMCLLYDECRFFTKESIVEIYEELSGLLDTLPEEEIRSSIIKGTTTVCFSTEGFIELYSPKAQNPIWHFPVDMSSISWFNGMYFIAHIDVDLRKNVLTFGFDSDAIADMPKDSIQEFFEEVKTWFDDSYVSDGSFSISLDYF